MIDLLDLLLLAIAAPFVVWLVLALVLNCCEWVARKVRGKNND